jgi:predicted ester cyclase
MSSESVRREDTREASGATDAVARNEETVRRLFDSVINDRDLAVADEICAPDCAVHVPGLSLPRGPAGLKEFVRELDAGFPDLEVAIDEVIATPDAASVRWRSVRQTQTGVYRGIPPTGRSISVTGTNFYRLESGQITDAWVQADSLGLAQQLGVVPPDDVGTGARVGFILGSLVRMGYLQARHSLRSRKGRRA